MRTLVVIGLALLALGGCKSGSEPKPQTSAPPAAAEEVAEKQPTPSQDPGAIKVGQMEAYLPDEELCSKVQPVGGSWREAPEVEMVLVPQRAQGEFRIVGRTNLPDNIVIFAGTSGLGGWWSEHHVVRNGCFVSPAYYIQPGQYVLDAVVTSVDELDPSVADEIGEYGWKLKKHIIDEEFRVETVVGIGGNPEKAHQERKALWDEYEAMVQGFIKQGLELGKLRAAVTRRQPAPMRG